MLTCTTSLAEVIAVKTKSITSYELALDGFKSVVNEKVVEYDMEGDFDKGRKIVKKVKKRVKKTPQSVILTIGLMASKLVEEEITNVPIIYCMVINPANNKLIGRKNVGGVSFDLSPESQLIRLQQVISEGKNIGVMYDPENSSNVIKKAEEAARSLNLNLIAKEVNSEKDVPNTLRKLIKKIHILWIIPDSTVLNRQSFKFISLTALENRVPVMACSPQLVKSGSCFCFFSDEFSIGRQAGLICQKILNGEIKGPVPNESPSDIFLAINLITSKRCGIKITQEIMNYAKEIYK